MLLAALRDTPYNIVLILHILAVMVGIGSVMLNGVYGVAARNTPGEPGIAIIKANHKASDVAMKFIYAIPIFGFALVGMSDKVWEFSQVWIWLALLLYIVAVGISHTQLKPSVNKIISIREAIVARGQSSDGPPPELPQLEALGQRIMTFAMVNSVLVIVILYLMVFKPGY